VDDLNTNIGSVGGNRVLRGTDGDDLIDANANVFTPNAGDAGAAQTLSGGQGADTIITSTSNDFRTVVRLGLEDNLIDNDGDADTVRVNSTGGTVDVFDFEDGDNGNDRGFQRVAGTDGDDLILTSAQSANFVDAGAGNDTIVIQGRQSDFIDTGAGRDTVVLSDENLFVTFSRDNFNTDEDVINLSGVSGVNNFDQLSANRRDDLVAANEVSGALEIEVGNGPLITFIDPDDAADLSEDNFIFAGDDAAVG